jgi:hypothetical protein
MMTKQEYVELLVTDPEYDADWIDSVSDLLSTYSEEKLNAAGIDNLDVLSKLDAKMVHVIYTIIDKYRMDYQSNNNPDANEIISSFIKSILDDSIHINNTQAQLIATHIDFVCRGDEEFIVKNKEYINEIIVSDIPYAALNYITKGIIEEYYEIIKFSNCYPKVVASVYATMADGVYNKINEKINLEDFISDSSMSENDLANFINTIRFAEVSNIKYEINNKEVTFTFE